METIDLIALMLGVAWASGINLYAAVLTLGLLASGGYTELPEGLQVLQDPIVIGAALLMYCVEFFADKTPGVDTAWDSLHTFIRIPAGAMLALGAAEGMELNQAAEFAALLLGGSLAAGTHLTKSGSRILINASPEPVSNWTASLTEDIVVIGGLLAALHYPVLFVIAVVVMVLAMIWLLPRLWRAIAAMFRKIGNWFRRDRDELDDPIKTFTIYTDSNKLE